MSPLEQIHKGASRAWDYLTEGWHHLRERANQALTQFTPATQGGQLETMEDQVMENASRWGLLAAEIKEDDKAVTVRLEAPGMEAGDFDIEVMNNALVIRGEKRVEREQSDGRYYVMERAYGRFERVLPLPAEVTESGSQAKYRRGVLWISLPKTRQIKHRVEVKSG
ncbi:Hsp20/alpha crystallin family protein [Nitrosococcus oceani]|uniref:Heat shock protein Hsp20 n=2 Tax=Nitrosococcus oceani TaxID=1229 RepID=Q3J7L2_NITOC|nr:Hsp20/alpha crystallin family protein [Nitrosococcus oceani]KFI18417.1 heat-shock protein Hsp20 [Nitrosococcus oceani C-27]ABA59184.1 heat shock protein Hsp20 [Nitrosococcus oceani ATCC 19707]EDZ66325.1 Hsp20/alpha crystallin family [Nitrosococcus oceani AFC27]KFI21643.1 heat-shock protein Hsp20 [Nitrosococcus oceani]GEM20286.1 heat-shock protein Hsp20 [Nitrosococcus oceani]